MTLAKREDGPLVSIAELVRYRPSAFPARDGKNERWGTCLRFGCKRGHWMGLSDALRY